MFLPPIPMLYIFRKRIHFARVCSNIDDINKCLTSKLSKRSYQYHKFHKAFYTFYYRLSDLIFKYNIF